MEQFARSDLGLIIDSRTIFAIAANRYPCYGPIFESGKGLEVIFTGQCDSLGL
jgi:hypothetical protein